MFVSSVLADANEMHPMTGLRMATSGPQLVISLKCEAPFPGAVITIVSYSLKPLPFLERLRRQVPKAGPASASDWQLTRSREEIAT